MEEREVLVRKGVRGRGPSWGRAGERSASPHHTAGELLVAVPCWRRTDEAGKTHVVGARGVECSEIKSMESHELNA